MRVAVIGAGLSGLIAARRIATQQTTSGVAAHSVTVFESDRVIGGRLATVAFDDARFDLGAQFFTVRGEALQRQVDDWLSRGVARVWCHGFGAQPDGYPRYIGDAGMAALAADLADGLDVRTDRAVSALLYDGRRWQLGFADGTRSDADTVVITAPAPQAWALLAQSPAEMPGDLARTGYKRTITLALVLDGPSAMSPPGAAQFDADDPDAVWAFVTDNRLKGISTATTLTAHATTAWSDSHWSLDRATLTEQLLAEAQPWVGSANVTDAQIYKWQFSEPREIWPQACWADPAYRVVVAGDVCAGPKVEGAFNSGCAAADMVGGWAAPS